MLLTTITLPANSWLPGEFPLPTTFTYVDPEDYAPGDDPDILNILTIGTLSGLPPEKDIVVEVLDYLGRDVPGNLSIAGEPELGVGGGLGGYYIVQEVPPNTIGSLGYAVDALATDPLGDTYGITDTGLLIEVDTVLGTVDNIIGQIADTENFFSAADIEFTDFDAASFDPITGELYAVAIGPTAFTAAGEVISTGEVLIRIDLSDDDGDGIDEEKDRDGIVEAEAAGRNLRDIPDYSYSVVELPAAAPGDPPPVMDILTIAYMETAIRPSLTEPIFIGFNSGEVEEETGFVMISLVESGLTDEVQVTTTLLAGGIEELAYGLMYDNQLRLWAALSDEGNGELREVIGFAYSEQEIPYSEEARIFLSGMSFDRLSNIGYATDPNTGTLYQINISGVELVDDDYVNIAYGDIYMMYIASSTADAYISIVHSDGAADGDPAILFPDVETPEDAGGVMIGTIPSDQDGDGIPDTWTPGFDEETGVLGTFFGFS